MNKRAKYLSHSLILLILYPSVVQGLHGVHPGHGHEGCCPENPTHIYLTQNREDCTVCEFEFRVFIPEKGESSVPAPGPKYEFNSTLPEPVQNLFRGFHESLRAPPLIA